MHSLSVIIDEYFVKVTQTKGMNYDALVAAEYCNIIENMEPFECAICFSNIDPGCGIVLRDCLHMFCSLAAVFIHYFFALFACVNLRSSHPLSFSHNALTPFVV